MVNPLTTVEGFTDRFVGEIRVAFNWHRFGSERWLVERIELRSPDQLAALEAPMCLDPDGHPCGLHDDGARRVTVGEVPGLLDRLGQRADFIREKAARYRGAGVMRDELPGYGIRGGAILMDGVHRSTAALIAEVPIELDLYVVRGPLDPDCLADLRI